MSTSRPWGDRVLDGALVSVAAITLAVLAAVPLVVMVQGLRGLSALGAEALGPVWAEGGPQGVLVPLLGTMQLTLVAMVLCLPLGLLVGIWLAHYAPPALRGPVRTTFAALAGTPSVVLGFVGLTAVAPALTWLPGVEDGRTLLAGALLLAVLALPAVVVRVERALRSVPELWFESALALGATRGEAIWRVVLPMAWRGVVVAATLGTARALGDSVAVLMATGVAATPGGLLEPVRALGETVVRELLLLPPGAAMPPAVQVVALMLLIGTAGLHAVATRRRVLG